MADSAGKTIGLLVLGITTIIAYSAFAAEAFSGDPGLSPLVSTILAFVPAGLALGLLLLVFARNR